VSGLDRIVLIGPESTGKTWLAERLAQQLGVPWSGEYARVFVETHNRPVVFDDVDAIGRGQQALEDAAIAAAQAAGAPCVIHDTDLVSTVVYSLHYFGECPGWLSAAAAERRAGLYLLLDIDVPWQEDGHMREAPERREELFARFRSTLGALGARTAVIGGGWAARIAAAAAACRKAARG